MYFGISRIHLPLTFPPSPVWTSLWRCSSNRLNHAFRTAAFSSSAWILTLLTWSDNAFLFLSITTMFPSTRRLPAYSIRNPNFFAAFWIRYQSFTPRKTINLIDRSSSLRNRSGSRYAFSAFVAAIYCFSKWSFNVLSSACHLALSSCHFASFKLIFFHLAFFNFFLCISYSLQAFWPMPRWKSTLNWFHWICRDIWVPTTQLGLSTTISCVVAFVE